jgi:protein TonB
VTHELIHVQRRDWLSVLAEEALRAVLWFHPAIWWLTSRVRLAREEFTDHLAVLATGSRRAYMEALLAFAERSGAAPAPAFARRTYLFHRIVLLSKEAAMSSRRVVLSGTLVTAVLVAGGWLVSDAFPLVKPPVVSAAAAGADMQLPPVIPEKANSVTPENPIPRRLSSTPIPYPVELDGSGFVAAVEMRVVLNRAGVVESATRGGIALSRQGQRSGGAAPAREDTERAMQAFIDAASREIRQWRYDPPAAAPLQFYVAVTFRPGQDALVSQSDTSRTLVAANGNAFVSSGSTIAGGSAIPGRSTAMNPLTTASGAQPVRVGGQIRAPMQIRKVNPEYPPIAQSARVQGVVILEALIDEQGKVADARVLRSIPLLDQAAIDAVRQWEYTPTLLNGAPVPVIMTVTVQFTLPAPTQPF